MKNSNRKRDVTDRKNKMKSNTISVKSNESLYRDYPVTSALSRYIDEAEQIAESIGKSFLSAIELAKKNADSRKRRLQLLLSVSPKLALRIIGELKDVKREDLSITESFLYDVVMEVKGSCEFAANKAAIEKLIAANPAAFEKLLAETSRESTE